VPIVAKIPIGPRPGNFFSSTKKVRAICEHINGNMQPLQNLRLMQKVHGDFGQDKIAWAKHWNEVGLKSLEAILAKTAGTYAFGDSVTLADLCIFPQASGAFIRFGISPEDYPLVSKVCDNLKVLPEFIDAMPQNQPDFVA
jgi:maleylacetoacetate isomerase